MTEKGMSSSNWSSRLNFAVCWLLFSWQICIGLIEARPIRTQVMKNKNVFWGIGTLASMSLYQKSARQAMEMMVSATGKPGKAESPYRKGTAWKKK